MLRNMWLWNLVLLAGQSFFIAVAYHNADNTEQLALVGVFVLPLLVARLGNWTRHRTAEAAGTAAALIALGALFFIEPSWSQSATLYWIGSVWMLFCIVGAILGVCEVYERDGQSKDWKVILASLSIVGLVLSPLVHLWISTRNKPQAV